MEVALSVWTDSDKDRIAALWADGKTASEISREYPGKTRNSIIGLLHRMKVPKRERIFVVTEKVKKEHPQQKKKTAFFIQRRQNQHRVPAIPVEPPRSVKTGEGFSLSQLRSNHCRDVIGYRDSNVSEAVYCGAEKYKNTSYCQYHSSIYHVPPRSR